MEKDLIEIEYSTEIVGIRSQRIKYIAEVTHYGLGDYKILSSDNNYILENKVERHIENLKERWDKIVIKQNIVSSKEDLQKESEFRTQEAIKKLKQIDNLLLQTLVINDAVDWETLKDKKEFKISSPEKELNKQLKNISKPTEPVLLNYPQEPKIDDFRPEFNFFDNIIKSKKIKKIAFSNSIFQEALDEWEKKCIEIDKHNLKLNEDFKNYLSDYDKKIQEIKLSNLEEVRKWEIVKKNHISRQGETNSRVDLLKQEYLRLDSSAVAEYCDLVLDKSEYPDYFIKSYELDYNPDNKILIVEYSLPAIDQFPTLNEVKVIKNDLKEYYISDTQKLKMFDNAMYNITLRTIHELFEADVANAIDAISFNGWVEAVNKATGKRENNCILSIQVKKIEFLEINLEHVDPKTCFKSLKGVGSSKLSGLTPIQPIMQINRTDKRFTNHYAVANSLDNSTNLASMDWEDFEHLIREVFAKEFSSNGGEVKVTQASRDGGVDAIAFDPDPIRGGKIVIQAKRYTNTVGVSAVRDLYGTVMNEGATKGILVTTADYGPDAYDFVKGKPLTLMNGANLLYLLEKHGHQARINIREAKETFK
jgi:restriction system protein